MNKWMIYNMNKITKSLSTFIPFSVSCHSHTPIVLMFLLSNPPFSLSMLLIHFFLPSMSIVSFILIKCKRLHKSTVLYIDLFLVFLCVYFKLCIFASYVIANWCNTATMWSLLPLKIKLSMQAASHRVWPKLDRRYKMFRRCFIRSVSVPMEATNSQNKIQPKYHFCVCVVGVCMHRDSTRELLDKTACPFPYYIIILYSTV